MKSTLQILLLLFLTTLCFAQNDKPQRAAFKFKLAENERHYRRIKVPQGNYFAKAKLLEIYASEKLNIECTLQNDTIATMKVVKDIVYPERTIVVDFSQQREGRKVIGMLLNVKNPFDKKLLYTTHMFVPGHDEWIATSTIPIHPHLQNFETWPHPIISLCLCDWRFEE
jgi:hypothetical protein